MGGSGLSPCHTNPGLSKWPSYLRVGPAAGMRRDLKRYRYDMCHLFRLAHAFNLRCRKFSDDEYIYAVLRVEHKKRH